MYLDFFGLVETPFSITPDPAFVYLSPRHRDALAHLLYGVGQGGSGGFVQLTGEVGTGKTTLCRCLLEQVPEDTRIALVLNPLLTPRELLAAICEELGIEVRGHEQSSKEMVDRLNGFLLAAHERAERVVVVIDEAQNLSPESLEQVRLLTNLETSKQKLLQIVLLGQPELRELLQRQSLRQLAQRITARYHLTPLNSADTSAYVRHRMQIAGATRDPFTNAALKALFQRSHGVPRLINIIADRALVAAYASERKDIDASLIQAAADEVQLGEPDARRSRLPWLAATAASLAVAWLAWAVMYTEPVPGPGAMAVESEDTPVVAKPAPADPVSDPVSHSESTAPAPDALDENWLVIQDQAAWRGLAALWGEPGEFESIEKACGGDRAVNWACLNENGSFARISQLGLPVVLQLQGDQRPLLLIQGLDDIRVLAGAPGTERSLSRLDVERRWLGGYAVAWPQAMNWPREISRGQSGIAVETVIRLAGNVHPPYPGAAVFGEEFEAWLKAFQNDHGLEADGIVGPRTLMYLMRPSITEPVLATRW